MQDPEHQPTRAVARSRVQFPAPSNEPPKKRAPGVVLAALRVARVVVLLGAALALLAATPLGRPLVPLEQALARLFATRHALTTAKSTATPRPTVLPTATPLPVGAPKAASAAQRLGGTLAAFEAQFGAPIVQVPGTVYGFQPYCGTGAADCEQVTLAIGQDGGHYVDVIALDAPPARSWDLPTARTICESYLPSDAQFVREVPVTNQGVNRIYLSATLAQRFPASVFLDGAGDYIQPGTIEIQYIHDILGGTAYGACQMGTGTV
jgi:hypothetical protein